MFVNNSDAAAAAAANVDKNRQNTRDSRKADRRQKSRLPSAAQLESLFVH